jgi:hypothetical protein
MENASSNLKYNFNLPLSLVNPYILSLTIKHFGFMSITREIILLL